MYKIEMLPAAHGDCLWIEYGDEKNINRILIDTGTAATYKTLRERILKIPFEERRFELFIITHVDADHIEGALPLLQDVELGVQFGDVWFNGWKHITDLLGAVQGEFLSSLLETQKRPWNKAFRGKAAVVSEEGKLPVIRLKGGMKITLLSPSREKLSALRPLWKTVVESEGLEPGNTGQALERLKETKKFRPADLLGKFDVEKLADISFVSDDKAPNGSSIAILAEYGENRCLFGADAHAPLLETTIDRLITQRGVEKLALDAFKIPHHGSKKNLNKGLLQKLFCDRYLISTNGNQFKHPDDDAISRIIKYGRSLPGKSPILFFNYKSKSNEKWENQQWQNSYKYKTVYPDDNLNGLSVTL